MLRDGKTRVVVSKEFIIQITQCHEHPVGSETLGLDSDSVPSTHNVQSLSLTGHPFACVYLTARRR